VFVRLVIRFRGKCAPRRCVNRNVRLSGSPTKEHASVSDLAVKHSFECNERASRQPSPACPEIREDQLKVPTIVGAPDRVEFREAMGEKGVRSRSCGAREI
jgi:hypothetical protein